MFYFLYGDPRGSSYLAGIVSRLPWHVTEDLSRYSSVNLLIWLDNARLSGDNWMVGLIETELDARVKGAPNA